MELIVKSRLVRSDSRFFCRSEGSKEDEAVSAAKDLIWPFRPYSANPIIENSLLNVKTDPMPTSARS